MTVIARARWIIAAMLMVGATACSKPDADDGFVRGPGLKTTQLPVPAKVAIYDASVRSAFDVGPGLVLMLDPRFLPRTRGLVGGTAMPKALADGLRASRVVAGTCEGPTEEVRQAPTCATAQNPGYIVRFSDVFRVAGDTVQVHLAVERYNTATSPASEILRFEKAYQLVGKGTTWRVARQGRVTQVALPAAMPL
jgi:hypothetical protein